jgi:hypothetical protein
MLVTLRLIGETLRVSIHLDSSLMHIWTVTSKHYTRSQRTWRTALVLAAYICSTIHAAVNWVYYSQAVNNNELPTGPGLLYSLTHIQVWIEGVGDTFFCLNIFMADCLFVSSEILIVSSSSHFTPRYGGVGLYGTVAGQLSCCQSSPRSVGQVSALCNTGTEQADHGLPSFGRIHHL